MPETLELENVVEDIVSSYEEKIESISSIFDTANIILNNFQETILNTKEKRGEISIQLRDILAKNEHLRRKDFDNMMQGILLTQEQRRKEVGNLLKDYINGQKSMAQGLKEGLSRFKDFLAKGEAGRVKEFQVMIKGILVRQDERKEEVASNLKEFQKEQQEIARKLKELLAKGRELRIKDLKLMLKDFKKE